MATVPIYPIYPFILTRRFILSRFPYCVVYKTYAGDCLVVAVMHQSQKPGYWKKRR
ncbi:MAG: hypothetical protein AB7E49_02710 [Campylobacterales bacterium]